MLSFKTMNTRHIAAHESASTHQPGDVEPIAQGPGLTPCERLVALAGIFVLALVAAVAIFKPWQTPAIGYDTASSVLYFDRLLAHLRLESYVGTTPKPAVTLIEGIGYNLTHDWHLVAYIATVEFAAMVAAAAALAWRIIGPIAAGMAALGLLGSQWLLFDGNLSYAYPWVILLWLLAGLALTVRSPRYGLAGALLFVAALIRLETFIVIGMAAATLALWRAIPPRQLVRAGLTSKRPPLRSLLLLSGLLALPVMILHDWLLTGNGLYWLNVSASFSTKNSSAVASAATLTQDLAQRAGTWELLLPALPAAIGGIYLLSKRQVALTVGLIACGPGILAFIEFLAFRHTYISYRYYIPVYAALVFCAAVGAEATVRAIASLARGRGWTTRFGGHLGGESARNRRLRAVLAIAFGAALAVAFVRPYGPIDGQAITRINRDQALQANADRAMPAIDAALADLPAPGWATLNLDSTNVASAAVAPRLYVPSLLAPRMAVDLGWPVWAIGGDSPIAADPADLTVPVATIVYIDVNAGQGAAAHDRPLEVQETTHLGHVTITPLLVLPADGLWVLKLVPD